MGKQHNKVIQLTILFDLWQLFVRFATIQRLVDSCLSTIFQYPAPYNPLQLKCSTLFYLCFVISITLDNMIAALSQYCPIIQTNFLFL